jgi:phage tail-like protein
MRKFFLKRSWNHRLGVFAAVVVLAAGLGVASAGSAFAVGSAGSSAIASHYSAGPGGDGGGTNPGNANQPNPGDDTGAVGHSLGLEVDGIAISKINEVTGLKMEQDVIELKQNTADGKVVIKKLPGRPKAGEVTLTRGLTADNSFDKWIKYVQFGKIDDARKNATVTVYDDKGQTIKRYKLTNSWPKGLEISSTKVGDTSVLTEKLVLTYERMDVE